MLPVGAKLNSPSSNSSKQSKYKCPILLERSFENLSGRDITSPSTASVEGARRLRSPTRGMTSTKSGKRWRCSVRRHRRLVMSTRVSWTCAEVQRPYELTRRRYHLSVPKFLHQVVRQGRPDGPRVISGARRPPGWTGWLVWARGGPKADRTRRFKTIRRSYLSSPRSRRSTALSNPFGCESKMGSPPWPCRPAWPAR